MEQDAVIRVENVGKQFRLHKRGARTVKSTALDLVRARPAADSFWALREIDFQVRRGEVLGIIGANGAGKSTLLSLLARTKEPTEGRIEMVGKISSLLELGAGFHPELTGRENVFLAGAIMGIPQARMRDRFDAIVEFAELREFIDQPVKHYSSGMYVRLGFAVAVEVDPDILLIDEVLAVGDASFQRRCLDRMAQFREERKTMLIISHDMDTIRKVSDRILYLEKGRVLGLGEPTGVLEAYASASRQDISAGLAREWGTGEVLITGVEILDEAGQAADTFRGSDALTARIRYAARERIERPVFGFGIANREGHTVHGNNTQNAGAIIEAVEGEGTVTLHVERLDLGAGTYLLSFSVHSEDHRMNYHRLDHHFPISVKTDKGFEGCHLPSRWEV